MTEIKKAYNQRLVDAYIETTPELHPKNRNEEKSFDNSNKFSEKRLRKKCVGCCDTFTCYKSKNCDYCSSCSLNGTRYLNKDSPCSECDGSGLIKFKNQPLRNCKLCYLVRQKEREDNFFAK